MDPYSYAVGSLMYAIVCTMLDITYVVSMVSNFVSNLSKTHSLAVKWIIRYLKSIMTTSFPFKKNYCDVLIANGYTDSNFTGDKYKRRSFSSYIFTIIGNTMS